MPGLRPTVGTREHEPPPLTDQRMLLFTLDEVSADLKQRG